MFRAAFYRSVHPGLPGLYNRVVRWWSSGLYSHCELVFSDGYSASASWMDGGVRLKKIDYDPVHWDFIDLPGHLEADARAWFRQHDRKPYDLLGNLGFVWRPVHGEEGAFFCSEACAAALGIPEAWRYSPNALASALTLFTRSASAGLSL